MGQLGNALNAMLTGIEGAFAARAASEERLRRFLADASHELRTPLTSIRGYAELFDRGARDRPEDLATSMRHIREEANRMSVLVDDLLLLARLDHERPLELEHVDLTDVVAAAVDAARLRRPERAISLEAPGPVAVVGRRRPAAPGRRQPAHQRRAAHPDGSPVDVRREHRDGHGVSRGRPTAARASPSRSRPTSSSPSTGPTRPGRAPRAGWGSG